MKLSLFERYQHLLPLACEWLLEVEALALEHGRPLTDSELEDARSVGVNSPENVRLWFVEAITLPTDPVLLEAAIETGLSGDGAGGRTVRYGIEIVASQYSRRLLRHELRHVQQFELAPSFTEFVADYVQSVLTDGYQNSIFERDARAYEALDG